MKFFIGVCYLPATWPAPVIHIRGQQFTCMLAMWLAIMLHICTCTSESYMYMWVTSMYAHIYQMPQDSYLGTDDLITRVMTVFILTRICICTHLRTWAQFYQTHWLEEIHLSSDYMLLKAGNRSCTRRHHQQVDFLPTNIQPFSHCAMGNPEDLAPQTPLKPLRDGVSKRRPGVPSSDHISS